MNRYQWCPLCKIWSAVPCRAGITRTRRRRSDSADHPQDDENQDDDDKEPKQ